MTPRLVLAVALLAGCAPAPPTFSGLVPFTGTVTLNGRPVTGGGLLFEAEPGKGRGLIVNANINPDGTFTAESCRVTGTGSVFAPGAPPGRYTVVFHPPGDGSLPGTGSTLAEPVVVGETATVLSIVLPMGPPAKPAGAVVETPPTGR